MMKPRLIELPFPQQTSTKTQVAACALGWRFAALLTLLLLAAAPARAGLATLLATDATGSSGFLQGTNWSISGVPSSANDYFVGSGLNLRTPSANGAAYTFGGKTLTVAGTLYMKITNIITVNNLTLTNGSVQQGSSGQTPDVTRLAGTINITSNATFNLAGNTRNLGLTAALSGNGAIAITNGATLWLSGAHTWNGALRLGTVTLDMDGTVSLTPSALMVGQDSAGTTNIVRAGGALNVGYGSAGDLRIGWRTVTNTSVNPVGVLDVSSQPGFNANVGNLSIGYNQALSGGTSASAVGIVNLATNNTVTATNVLMADTVDGTSATTSQLTLGRGSNYFDTPVMVVGGRKAKATLTLPAGGILVLTNSAGRTDLTIGGNKNITTAITPTDLMDLGGGRFIATLSSLTVGNKSGGGTGGVIATLTTATNSANAVDVIDLSLGSMTGADAGTTAAASGTFNFNGGTLNVSNSITLGTFDLVAGAAAGALTVNGEATVTVGGSITNGGGASTVNFNGALLNLVNGGSITVDTLMANGVVSNVNNITVSNLSGSGTIYQSGRTVVTSTLNPGTGITAGTLKLGPLSLDPAAVVTFNLNNTTNIGAGINDFLDVTGDLALNNAQLNIVPIGGSLVIGTYRLANFAGEVVGGLQMPTVGRYSFSLQVDTTTSPKHVNLVVSGTPVTLRWGGELGSAWDINSTYNWTNIADHSSQVFFESDTVVFDDFSQNPYVTMDLPVHPGNVTVSNNNNAYTFASNTGSGGISGATALAKQGSGSLTITTSNDFTGPVTITGGQLIAGNPAALGTADGITTVASGGTLDIGGQNLGGEIVHVRDTGFDGNGAIINNGGDQQNALLHVVLDGPATLGGAGFGRWDIRGTGTAGSASLQGATYPLTKAGPNTVALAGGCNVTVGDVLVSGGILSFESAGTMNNGYGVTVNSGAAFSLYQLSAPFGRNITLQDGGTLRTTSGTAMQNVIAGSVTLNGVGNFEATSSGANLNLVGPVTGPGALVKVGPGTAILTSAANNWAGGTTINAGTLQVGNGLSNGSLPASPPVIVDNATLQFNPATTVTPLQEITGAGGLSKRGDGTLSLTVSNSFTGNFTSGDGGITGSVDPTSGGIIRLLNPYGFGDPGTPKTVQIVRAELRLEGGMVIPINVNLQVSSFSTVTGAGVGLAAVRNIAGTNWVPNSIQLVTGAGHSEFASDAGLLVIDGPISLTSIARRSVMFGGAATGIANGVISDLGTTLDLEKHGSGTWRLTATNTYSGTTTVNAGTLLVNGIIGGSTVFVYNGVLGGTGEISAPVTVYPTATLSPGDSIGTLTFDTALYLNGNLLVELNKSLSQSNDFVQVSGAAIATGSGTVTVTNLGPALVAGDTFTLFSQPVSGGDTLRIISTPGVVWTNNLAVDGSISVVSASPVVNTNPPYLTNAVLGTNLVLTWPDDHRGWRLQIQTNQFGIGTNWHDWPDSTNNISATIPINPKNPPVFLRMAFP